MVSEIGRIPYPHVAASTTTVGPQYSVVNEGHGVERLSVEAVEQEAPDLLGQSGQAGFLSRYSQIASSHEERGEAALRVRAAQTALKQVDGVLEDIKSKLTEIVKQYPPFATDHPTRVDYLNKIAGLRKQVEALTFPPGQRAQNEEQGLGVDWYNATPPEPGYLQAGDLAIPELDPQKATDEELAAALDFVSNAQEKVAQVAGEMWEDVVNYVGSLDTNAVESQIGRVREYISSASVGIVPGARDVIVAGS